MADLISPDFTFTQSNLQTFDYCRQRFYLRYVRKLIWPAQLVSNQQHVQDRDSGVRFHRIIHQYFLGFDPALLQNVAQADPDPRIEAWFITFLSSQMSHLEGTLYPEILYTTTISGHPLSAKVDLLQLNGGLVKVYDWKTSRQLPKLPTLQKQIQSKVYPLVISRVYGRDAGEKFLDDLTLIYWEANFPDQTIEIKSTQAEWQKYELEITNSVALIHSLAEGEFVLTPDERKCAWCEYRSYCQRGKTAQSIEDFQETNLIDEEMKINGDVFDAFG